MNKTTSMNVQSIMKIGSFDKTHTIAQIYIDILKDKQIIVAFKAYDPMIFNSDRQCFIGLFITIGLIALIKRFSHPMLDKNIGVRDILIKKSKPKHALEEALHCIDFGDAI